MLLRPCWALRFFSVVVVVESGQHATLPCASHHRKPNKATRARLRHQRKPCGHAETLAPPTTCRTASHAQTRHPFRAEDARKQHLAGRNATRGGRKPATATAKPSGASHLPRAATAI